MLSKAIMISYLLATIIIGIVLSSRKVTAKQLLVASGNLGVPMLVAFIFAELIGAPTVSAATANGKTLGLSVFYPYAGQAVGCIIAVLLLGNVYRAYGKGLGTMTMPEIFVHRFSRRTGLALTITNIIFFFINYALQPKAAATVLCPMFGLSETTVVIGICLVMALVTATGGLKGIAGMNVVHTMVLFFGVIFMLLSCLSLVNGFSNLRGAVDPALFSLARPSIPTAFAYIFAAAVSSFVGAVPALAMFSSKSERTGKAGMLFGGAAVATFIVMLALIGISSNVILGGGFDANTYYRVAEAVGPVMAGVAAMAIIAAMLSTATSLLLFTITLLTNDIYGGIIKPDASDGDKVRFFRIMCFVVAGCGVVYGMMQITLLSAFTGVLQMRSIAGIIIVLGAFWPRFTEKASFWGLLSGGAAAGVWATLGSPYKIAALYPGLVVAVIVILPLTLASKEAVSPGYQKYRNLLDKVESERTGQQQLPVK